MNSPTLVQRLRRQPAAVAGADSRRPLRLWMTGSLAVVMAALAPARDLAEPNRSDSQRLVRHSRYGVSETMQRIEAEARSKGLSVMARFEGTHSAIVLASSVGGTPVVMSGATSRIEMPLSLQLREGPGGHAEVLVAGAQAELGSAWQELPAGVTEDLACLPELLDRALT